MAAFRIIRDSLAALALAACAYAVFLLAVVAGTPPESTATTCATDWECAQIPECLADPTCVGGPN